MKLRSKDIKLAKSTKYLSSTTRAGLRNRPEDLLDYATKCLGELGYRLKKKKGPKSWKAKRMTTTLRKTVFLGVNWDSKTPRDRAATLMHELVHANQSKTYGFWKWVSRYVASARFRFAMEAQAYRETCRAYRAMGLSERNVRNYADDLPNRFIKSYWILNRRMRKDVRKHMERIVLLP